MNNLSLLEQQLDYLQQVDLEIESRIDSLLITRIQSKRVDLVQRVYADLAEQARYRKAVNFLADDLLGGNQLGKRGKELLRAKRPMAKMLPDALLGTIARSVEFAAVTLQIELMLAKFFASRQATGEIIADEAYAAAVRSEVDRSRLETQIGLVVKIGEEIEAVVNRPFIATALKMCRGPARMMGLEELQDFLERGFEAFRSMRGSREFITTFSRRENEIIEGIYNAHPNPFGA